MKTFVLKQNYANLNYLDIIVKASISLDAPAKNMVLRNAETQVCGTEELLTSVIIHSHNDTFTEQYNFKNVYVTNRNKQTVSSCTHAGESHGVSREGSNPVWWSSLVDHPRGCPGWYSDVGVASVSTLEGKDSLAATHLLIYSLCCTLLLVDACNSESLFIQVVIITYSD